MASKAETAPSGDNFLQYGGQAIIEGVMMRSPHYFAVACRKPDGGIVVQREEVDKGILRKLKWLNRPFLRGTLALLDAMILGGRALAFASNVQLVGEQEKQAVLNGSSTPAAPSLSQRAKEEVVATAASGVNGPPTASPTKMPASGRINDIAIGGTIVVSLIVSMFIFRIVPTTLTEILEARHLITLPNNIARNGMDGLIRLSFFFIYILLISRLDGVRRVFQYHGAEHKAINTLEAKLPLTRNNALQASRIHPRCGTSFIFVVLMIDLLVCLTLPRPVLYQRILLHLAVLPPVAGISYEVIKWAGRFRKNILVRAVFGPGMATQLLTTREPDPHQVEVALAALYSVLEAEGHHAIVPTDVASPSASDPDEPAMATA